MNLNKVDALSTVSACGKNHDSNDTAYKYASGKRNGTHKRMYRYTHKHCLTNTHARREQPDIIAATNT